MTIEQAKQLDLVDYLSSQGFEPSKISGNSYWYNSPLRNERTPSFKVNRKLNRWYDFGEGKGGNLVDLGVLLHRCNVSEFLRKLGIPAYTLPQLDSRKNSSNWKQEEINSITILDVHVIRSYPLLKYLHERRIKLEIAPRYLQEVDYQIGDKKHYALGFKNDAGGYELRNASFKGSSSPKDSTFIDNGGTDVAVFEGFFNFLSYKNMYDKQEEPLRNFVVLNSTSFFEKNLPKMQEHQRVHLFLDNDKTGQKFTDQALALDKQKFRDERRLYKGYEDLNDWLMHIGQAQRQQIRFKI